MKIVQAMYQKEMPLSIHSFGREDDSLKAHWGRGKREVMIVHYVLSGEGYYNGRKVRQGEGFCILPDEMHEYHSSETHPWQYVWVTFGGTEAIDVCGKRLHADADGIFAYDYRPELLRLFDDIMEEKGLLSFDRALGYFFLLMSLHENKGTGSERGYVDKAKRYMRHNFYRAMTITEMAEDLGISDRYLYNLFVEAEGIPPKQYLNRLRLLRAKEMLENSTATVSEVAVSCGFSDVLAFSRFFSGKENMSPTAYRRLAAKGKREGVVVSD